MVNSLDSGSLEAANRPWHSRASDDVLSALSATRDGLSPEEAVKRLAEHGANVLDKKGGVSVLALIWGQINNPLIWVLIGSAAIATKWHRSQASTLSPCFSTTASSLSAMPLGRLVPASHFCTVDSLVFR